MQITSDTTLNTEDPGDDIQRRFRYQSTYAAILSSSMLQDDSKIEEVFCELHLNILLKLMDGKFHGVQVKTRQLNHLPTTNFSTTSAPSQTTLTK
jgi:hypothetical protein